jgi:hypothetical protein
MFGIFGLGPSEVVVLAALVPLVLAGLGLALLLTRGRGPRDGEG